MPNFSLVQISNLSLASKSDLSCTNSEPALAETQQQPTLRECTMLIFETGPLSRERVDPASSELYDLPMTERFPPK